MYIPMYLPTLGKTSAVTACDSLDRGRPRTPKGQVFGYLFFTLFQ